MNTREQRKIGPQVRVHVSHQGSKAFETTEASSDVTRHAPTLEAVIKALQEALKVAKNARRVVRKGGCE